MTLGGIGTRCPSKGAVADPLLRPCGNCGRLLEITGCSLPNCTVLCLQANKSIPVQCDSCCGNAARENVDRELLAWLYLP